MKVCSDCGNHNEDREQFCTHCSSFLEWTTLPVGSAPTPAAAAATSPVRGDGQHAQLTAEVPSIRRPDAPAPLPDAPQLRQPEETPVAPPRAPRIVPAEVPEVIDVAMYCSACGAGNEAHKHFCRRCGRPLAQSAAANRQSWWRRWLQRRREAPAGDRPFPDETTFGSLVRTFLVTVLLVVAIGSMFAYLALPGFRAAVNREIDIAVTYGRRQVDSNYVQVRPTTTRASSEVTGHPAQLATDLVNNDYWAADLSRDPQPTLTLTFTGATDLDSIVVTNGAAKPDYARLARPRTLEISYSDGTAEQVTLKDAPDATPYVIHARGVTSLTVRIVNVYPGDGSTRVGLVEMEFWRLA